MVRVLNFFCVAAMGLTILALYHVSEATRVARVQLSQVGHQIEDTKKLLRSACCRPNGSVSPVRPISRNLPNGRA